MARIRRFVAVLATLTVAAAFTATSVLGDGGDKSRQRRPAKDKAANIDGDKALTEDLAGAKFASGGVLTYRTRDGALLFALQVKPKLDAAPERPVDYLIMVDTSASQVGMPLANAKKLAEQVVSDARATTGWHSGRSISPRQPGTWRVVSMSRVHPASSKRSSACKRKSPWETPICRAV